MANIIWNVILVLNMYPISNSKWKQTLVIVFYSATMPYAASRYSSSELKLCGLKKSILHFQYLLKYLTLFNYLPLF